MTIRVKIGGIYDQRTLKTLLGLGIRDLGFDFRPKSFNFLQHHKLLELLKGQDLNINTVYLSFCNEQNFVIDKFLKDLELIGFNSKNLVLEFSDTLDINFYQQFKMPYNLEYHHTLDDYSNCPYLQGLAISADFLEKAMLGHEFPQLVSKLKRQFAKLIKDRNFHFSLISDWDTELYSSYFKFLPIDRLSLSINSKIEVCYRNVNLEQLKLIKKITNMKI